jgi:ATP/ADP translocase
MLFLHPSILPSIDFSSIPSHLVNLPLVVLLAVLVYGGAVLYVFSRSAKFSLFKPAEEMVYISLDHEGMMFFSKWVSYI